jgi:hypothetical protein
MANHANDPNAPFATPVPIPEHYATEADNTHLYVPKGDVFTSMQPRITLPYVEDGAVRNHAVMATTTSANTVDRQRSLAQLKRMAADANDGAVTMMEALKDLVIEERSSYEWS